MIERVEQAIADQLGLDLSTLYANKSEWTADHGERHDINTPYRSDITDAAKAAIQAMREPTGAMQADGRDALEPYVGVLKREVDDQWHLARLTWAAMIGAALGADEGGTEDDLNELWRQCHDSETPPPEPTR